MSFLMETIMSFAHDKFADILILILPYLGAGIIFLIIKLILKVKQWTEDN